MSLNASSHTLLQVLGRTIVFAFDASTTRDTLLLNYVSEAKSLHIQPYLLRGWYKIPLLGTTRRFSRPNQLRLSSATNVPFGTDTSTRSAHLY